MRLLAFISIGLLFGCGSAGKFGGKSEGAAEKAPPAAPASTPQSPEPAAPAVDHHSLAVADVTALPTCDAAAEGWLVYLKAEKKFQTCDADAWSDIDIAGPAGPAGSDGKDASAASLIAEQYGCLSSANLGDSTTQYYGVSAYVTKFISGDYQIFCEDKYSSATFTDSDSSSATYTWRADSKGVADGKIECLPSYVIATFDLNTHVVTYSEIGAAATADVTCKAL